MSKAVPVETEAARGFFPIRTVSELTGVNSITLRAWENRYGLIEPVRKESGHRLYTQEHIDLITRVVGLLDRGMRIGQVKAFLAAEEQSEIESQGLDDVQDTWRKYLDGMLAGVIRFDEGALEEVYSEALSHYPIKTVTRNLITPLLVELGKRWEQQIGTVAEEHFFGFYLRNKLGSRFHHRARNTRGPKILMACLPGERHEVGLLMFALAANDAGYRPVILGADMPLEELPEAAEKIGCDAIVLSGLINPASDVIKAQLPKLAKTTPVPVLIGGQISVRVFDAIKRMGLEAVGVNIDKGLERLEQIAPSND